MTETQETDTETPSAETPNAPAAGPVRAVIALGGEEAREFLAGLVTNSLGAAAPDALVFAALLTPQGKILHTMFVGAETDGRILIDVAADGADDLIRRLTMFRLRRKIAITDLRGEMSMALGEGAPDPRHPDLPHRAFVTGPERADWAAYEDARMASGVPDQGRDYGGEEIFPADANMDLLAGMDLKKGCFIGQEVVSRMHRKGGVRKRMAKIAFEGPAPAYGAEIRDAANAAIGTVRSTADGTGIALVRVDRLETAEGALTAEGAVLTVAPPPR